MKIKNINFLWIVMLIFTHCASSPPPDFSEEDWFAKTQAVDPALIYASNLTEKGAFYNPWLQRDRIEGSWRSRDKAEYEVPDRERYGPVPNDYSYLQDAAHNSITFAGHASMIVKMDGETIFTDPFFSSAALIVRKKEIIKFDYSMVPQRPVVLISHNHYDHLDKQSVKNLAKKDAIFIVPLGLKNLIVRYNGKEVHELDWWQSVTINEIEYTLLPAQHWSRRIGQAGGETLWGSFMIKGSKTVYFSGDSGYFIGFREFGNRWNVDYAIIGVGAYEPRWFMHYSHLNMEEFFRATQDMRARYAIPMHFGAISLSDEPLLYPLLEIDRAIAENPDLARTVRPLRVGEYLMIE
jgi:L-ascorbate metabolism protein UlaG (beta-lactamase superfamily)